MKKIILISLILLLTSCTSYRNSTYQEGQIHRYWYENTRRTPIIQYRVPVGIYGNFYYSTYGINNRPTYIFRRNYTRGRSQSRSRRYRGRSNTRRNN